MTSYPQHFYQPPAGATQVVLVRHGQSEPYVPGSPFPLVDGHGDPHLTELGHYQARLVGDRLAEEGITAIYTSTLTRTKQTAAPLAETLGLSPIVEPDLREVFLGEAEGGRFRELLAQEHPWAVKVQQTGEWGHIPGAETRSALTARVVAAVERIADANPGGMVAAFCHGGVISAALTHAAQTIAPWALSSVRHTSLNHLVLSPGDDGGTIWKVRSFNDGAHAGSLSGDRQPPANEVADGAAHSAMP